MVQRALASVSGGVAGGAQTLSIVEWHSPFDPLFPLAPWLYGALLVLGLASFAATRWPLRPSRLLLFVAMALLGAWAIRFLTGFAIVSALSAIANLGDPAPWLRQRLARPHAAPLRALYPLAAVLLATAGLFVAVGTWAARSHFELGQSRGHFFILNPRHASPGAARFILEHELPGPIFNEQALGGYLEYALYPKHKLFIDGRILDYELLALQARSLNTPEGWRRAAQRFGFRSVVLSNLARALLPLRGTLVADPGWQLVYLDPQASVFVRVAGTETQLVPELREAGDEPGALPFGAALESGAGRLASRLLMDIRGQDQLGIYLGVLLQLERYDAVVALAGRALESVPQDPILRAHRAFAYVRLGRFAEAEADFRSVLEARPDDASVLRNHAIVLRKLGREAEARQQLERIRALP